MNHGHARRGKYRSREYTQWAAAKGRCFNCNNTAYERYGGRGITMSWEWADNFIVFLTNMGPCPIGMTLERINNSGNYERDNCRWATYKDQGRNKRSNHLLTLDGETSCLSAWAEHSGISHTTILRRLRAGKSPKEAVNAATNPVLINAKLTPSQVKQIKKLSGCLPQRIIAQRFNVHRHSISRIINGQTWKHF